MSPFSRCLLFSVTLRDSACNPARCNEKQMSVVLSALVQSGIFLFLLHSTISPLGAGNSVALQFCFVVPLLHTVSHLAKSSRAEQLCWSSKPLANQLEMLPLARKTVLGSLEGYSIGSHRELPAAKPNTLSNFHPAVASATAGWKNRVTFSSLPNEAHSFSSDTGFFFSLWGQSEEQLWIHRLSGC